MNTPSAPFSSANLMCLGLTLGTPREVFSRVKDLKTAHLTVPQVTELAYELKQAGLPLPDGILTREELVAALTKR